jgi:hypothetical protein
MATFEATRNMRVQRHFEVFEIDMPVITGACTIGSAQGYGTPLTCDQSWTGEYKTYYFTNENAPILPSINGEPIWRCIKAIKETATELKPGRGLSGRGSLNITFTDFTGQDPNFYAPAVNDTVKKQGTFFGKFDARQIFENRQARLKLYRVQEDGSIDLSNGAETRSYISNALRLNSSSGDWTVECKDVLSVANLNEKSWPIATGGFLRLDVDDTVVSIPVDDFTDYSAAVVVRVGEEFLKVNSVTDNLTITATLNVATRGAPIDGPVSGVRITSTIKDDHDAGDEVFICSLSDNETIDDLIAKILIDSDVNSSLIPFAEWAAEVAEWHATDKINTLHSESESVNDVLVRVLTGFLMDLWYSTTENKIKLSAITVWKESDGNLTEGKEINSYTLKKNPEDSLRASRALVLYDKQFLSANDDVESYKRASQFQDPLLATAPFFGKHKDKQFDNNFLLNEDSANLLTQRFVSRFKFTPYIRPWVTEERFLTFKTGDVVDISAQSEQSFDGLASDNLRAQITKINPRYTNSGRYYDVTAMTYEPAFNTGTEIILNSTLTSINLFTLAGAPSQDVDIVYILDGGNSQGNVSIRAGSFSAGSKVIIIMVNGFDGQASGGNGGNGESIEYDAESGMIIGFGIGNGQNGGTVYDAQGINTDIYFSGATPSTSYPIADGYIRAPSGGAGGFDYTGTGPWVSGDGGRGGDGRLPGSGGDAGTATGANTSQGVTGVNGEVDGTGSGWGNAGANNDATGGAAGSGIIDSGATTVNLFADGDLATRYINGNGSHP